MPEHTWNSPPNTWHMLKPVARHLRKDSTPPERLLWKELRGKQRKGFKFRRQHGIGPFIADFFCMEARLVIELDGSIHDTQKEHDAIRQQFIEAHGLRVIRFSNDEVLGDINSVLSQIDAVCSTPPPAPPR